MATANPNAGRAPWYARTATTAGRPVVLTITLLMCAPGEYQLARLAGWSAPFAFGMPFALSAYAGIAAVVAATRPRGARGRGSAIAGAAAAIVFALAAQVVSHLITTGHLPARQAWLVAIVSAVPPAVVGHLLHLAATPAAADRPAPAGGPDPDRAPAPRLEQPLTPVTPVTAAPAPVIPPQPSMPPALPAITYRYEGCDVIRALYASGHRPGTATMRTALTAAGYTGPASDGHLRGKLRAEVEQHEPRLANYPAEPNRLTAVSA